ncbi:MAG: hypothetical protein JO073_07930 [Actinobacteria bacterium]|nr:hypothetical protein [Actinomycetota bacterium]
MTTGTAVALGLAAASTTLTNVAYLREHDAAVKLPPLDLRHPVRSVRLLVGSRDWMRGFAMESTGFLLYVAALALAPIALVQSIAAGGIGVLAFVSARVSHRSLAQREVLGVVLSIVGLVALAVSLTGGSGDGTGELGPILLWLGATAAVAVVLFLVGRRHMGAAAYGAAGGLFFSIGDISTKVATQGGVRAGFAVLVVAGYGLGTALIQLGYQAGGALTVAGLATLLTNALPIAAGPVILDEPMPTGAMGGVRILAFVAVIAGAVLLSRPQSDSTNATSSTAHQLQSSPGSAER